MTDTSLDYGWDVRLVDDCHVWGLWRVTTFGDKYACLRPAPRPHTRASNYNCCIITAGLTPNRGNEAGGKICWKLLNYLSRSDKPVYTTEPPSSFACPEWLRMAPSTQNEKNERSKIDIDTTFWILWISIWRSPLPWDPPQTALILILLYYKTIAKKNEYSTHNKTRGPSRPTSTRLV